MPTINKQKTTSTRKKGTSVIDRITPLGFGEDEGIKVLLYGASGSGKTTLAGTFPGPLLWIVCSGGMRPGELRSINTPEMRKKVKSVVLRNIDEAAQIIAYIRESGEFKTVVLDHVSGLQDLALKEAIGMTEEEELPAQKGWGIASQQAYGESTLKSKEVCRALLNLSCNVVINGQERVFGGRDDGIDSEVIRPTVGVATTPSLAGWLNPACDYVLQMFKRPRMVTRTIKVQGKTKTSIVRGKGVEYCARTEPHETFMTKFRVPRGVDIPDVIEDPSYQKIMDLINGKIEKRTASI